MKFDDNPPANEKQSTISRRSVLEALGTGIIASGVIGCKSKAEATFAYDDKLTPEVYNSSVRARPLSLASFSRGSRHAKT